MVSSTMAALVAIVGCLALLSSFHVAHADSSSFKSTTTPSACFDEAEKQEAGAANKLEFALSCLRDSFGIIKDQLDDGTEYTDTVPTEAEMTAWRATVTDMLKRSNSEASAPCPNLDDETYVGHALAQQFEVRELVAKDVPFCVLYETATKKDSRAEWRGDEVWPARDADGLRFARGWGVFVVPRDHKDVHRDVHVSVAHLFSDGPLQREAAEIMATSGVASLLLSMTSRNAAENTESTCQPGFATNAAHDTKTAFAQAALAIVAYQRTGAGSCQPDKCSFVQLHGKDATTCPLADVFISPGLPRTPEGVAWFAAHPTTPSTRLQAALTTASTTMSDRWNVTTIATDTSCELTAGTNILGRVLNGVSDGAECTTNAVVDDVTGVFVHVEQAFPQMDNKDANVRHPEVWASAVRAAWPCREGLTAAATTHVCAVADSAAKETKPKKEVKVVTTCATSRWAKTQCLGRGSPNPLTTPCVGKACRDSECCAAPATRPKPTCAAYTCINGVKKGTVRILKLPTAGDNAATVSLSASPATETPTVSASPAASAGEAGGDSRRLRRRLLEEGAPDVAAAAATASVSASPSATDKPVKEEPAATDDKKEEKKPECAGDVCTDEDCCQAEMVPELTCGGSAARNTHCGECVRLEGAGCVYCDYAAEPYLNYCMAGSSAVSGSAGNGCDGGRLVTELATCKDKTLLTPMVGEGDGEDRELKRFAAAQEAEEEKKKTAKILMGVFIPLAVIGIIVAFAFLTSPDQCPKPQLRSALNALFGKVPCLQRFHNAAWVRGGGSQAVYMSKLKRSQTADEVFIRNPAAPKRESVSMFGRWFTPKADDGALSSGHY